MSFPCIIQVEVNGKRYPIKQALAATAGLLRGGFTTHDAMRVFRKLSFSVGTEIGPDSRILEWVNKLLALAEEVLSKDVNVLYEDNFGFMALCFLSKQIEHLQSIVTLTPRLDAILVARSMIEGLFQLLWVGKEPVTRSLQWRAFTVVHDLRVMQDKITKGEPVDPSQRTAIENGLRQYGDLFLLKKKAKAKKAQSRGVSLSPDSYHKNWRCGLQMRQTGDAVGGDDLYKKLYAPFSDWQHWEVSGFKDVIKRQGNRVVYSSLSAAESVTALVSGFQCLWQTIELINKHFEMGLAAKISELREGLLAALT